MVNFYYCDMEHRGSKAALYFFSHSNLAHEYMIEGIMILKLHHLLIYQDMKDSVCVDIR